MIKSNGEQSQVGLIQAHGGKFEWRAFVHHIGPYMRIEVHLNFFFYWYVCMCAWTRVLPVKNGHKHWISQ